MQYCSKCGAVLNLQSWPKSCTACRVVHYGNPNPVAICLLRVSNPTLGDGILIGRRPEQHFMTPWALIGGYVERTDPSVEYAATRELWEETGIKVEPSSFDITSSAITPSNQMLLFCTSREPEDEASMFAQFGPTSEILEIAVTRKAINLAFPLHTRALSDYFLLTSARR